MECGNGPADGGTESPIRILLLEDSNLDAELICESLKGIGLAHVVDRVIARQEYSQAVDCSSYDLILADYVLPSFDGLAALKIAHKQCPTVPFVFVSGTLGEDVAVEALKLGATDYVTKHRLDRLPRTVLRALAEAKSRRERDSAARALRDLNATLERRVEERTRALAAANEELHRQVTERERVEAALRQAQRLEAVGQLTSGVAHDFNNLLTVISGNVAFLERAAVDAAAKRRLDMIRQAAERGATLTSQLLAFSLRQRLDPKPIDLSDAVRSMGDLLQSSMRGAVRIDTRLQDDLWSAMVDPTHTELVILNLAINARDAMEVGGTLTIETGNVTVGAPSRPEEPPAGEYVMVSVADTGSGMSGDTVAKAFEPFFTTKEVGKGSGLGLAQVYGFAKQSGGGVRIDTKLGEGTSVKVFLPRANGAAKAAPAAVYGARRPERHLDGSPTILVVDDDSAVREITVGILSEAGCDVVELDSGNAALALLASPDRPDVNLMVVDFAMPGMNGAEVARMARQHLPDLPILFVTGYADRAALTDAAGASEDRIVQKPFRGDELVRKAKALVSGNAA